MRRLLFSLLAPFAIFTPFALADVEFTYPAAGQSITAGSIVVKWTDSGITPKLSQLTSYTLTLMVGGNDVATALQIATIGASPGEFSTGNTATGTISPAIASTLTNGFYLKMISNGKDGGTVTNYSNRFTIIGMTGTTPAKYQAAVQALGGSTAGPPTVNDVVANAGPNAVPAAAPAASVPPGADEFNVPYTLQTGLTKYAPMQPIPPTKITKKSATPQYPTSAFTIAKTYLAPPIIFTTVTQPQTFSVKSIENTIAAQSRPTGDMAKFLARWKD